MEPAAAPSLPDAVASALPPDIPGAVWQFLLEHSVPGGEETAVVTGVRQEEIARRLGLPLGHVIEAVRRLQHEGRLRAQPQEVGRPFRYLLTTDAEPVEDAAPARAA